MLSILGVCMVMTAAPAAATPTWPNTPTVTCDTITIDPTSWIKVTFSGTVNGAPFTQSALYGGDGSHNAHVTITSLTAGEESAHIVVTASSNFGFGPVTSATADVTLDCGSIITEGSTTIAPPHDPNGGGGTHTTGAKVHAASHGSGGALPFTGGDAARLTLVGGATLAVGLCASRVRTRRRARRRLPRSLSTYD